MKFGGVKLPGKLALFRIIRKLGSARSAQSFVRWAFREKNSCDYEIPAYLVRGFRSFAVRVFVFQFCRKCDKIKK